MSMVFSIRIPEELAKELAQIAAETERPRSFHVNKAIETYVREFADVQIALDRLRPERCGRLWSGSEEIPWPIESRTRRASRRIWRLFPRRSVPASRQNREGIVGPPQ